jgi:hypothetical protein
MYPRFAASSVSKSFALERSAAEAASAPRSQFGVGSNPYACPTARCCFISGVSAMWVLLMPSGIVILISRSVS